MSSEASCEFALLRLDDKIVQGQSSMQEQLSIESSGMQGQLSIESSGKFPWLDDDALRETWVGFQSIFEVNCV